MFTQNPKIEEAPLQGELMLFDPETSKFYVLNRTMAFVWRRCDGSHTPEAMLEGLQREFAAVGLRFASVRPCDRRSADLA